MTEIPHNLSADTGLVDSTDPGWIQSESDTLTGLFDRVGLRTNIRKTVGMECNPLWETGVQVDKAYTWRMMGEVRIFKERQRERVLCLECDKEFAKGSLVAHHQNQHGMVKGRLGQEGDKEAGGENARTCRMDIPANAGPRPCQFEGCSDRVSTLTAMCVHFWHRHVRDTVVILEEVNLPHPR